MDGGPQDLTLFGVQGDPDFLLGVNQISSGPPTVTTDYHGGTLVTFAASSAAIDFVGDRHIGYVVAPSNYPDTPPGYDFFNV